MKYVFFSVTYSPFCIEAAFCENAFIMTEGALQTGALSALLLWEVKGQEAVMQCKCTGMGFRVH